MGAAVSAFANSRDFHGLAGIEAKGTQGWRELCELGGDKLHHRHGEVNEDDVAEQGIMLVERRSLSHPDNSLHASTPPRAKVREGSCDARIEGTGSSERNPVQRGIPTVWSPGDYKVEEAALDETVPPPALPRERTF